MRTNLPSREECIAVINSLEKIEKDLEDDQRILDILDTDDVEKLAKVSALVALLLDLKEDEAQSTARAPLPMCKQDPADRTRSAACPDLPLERAR